MKPRLLPVLLCLVLTVTTLFAAVNSNQVSIPTTAGGTLIWQASVQTPNTSKMGITILNTDSTNTIYIGAPGLTASTGGGGFPLKAGAAVTFRTQGPVYGLAVGGTVVVAYVADDNQ
jgi:hypothetical protein